MRCGRLILCTLIISAVLLVAGVAGAAEQVHEVKRGDTLWLLAAGYGSSVNEIQSANGLRGDRIYPGMQLTIPGVVAGSGEQASARAIPWATVNGMFARGSVVEVQDVRTGLSFNVRRRGGWAHADVEPVTWQDTSTLRQIYEGSWSWSRRPIVVTIRGVRVAASMNGMPHGGQVIANNGFSGHHCIHFLNSTTHGSRRVCNNHQAAVRAAVGN